MKKKMKLSPKDWDTMNISELENQHGIIKKRIVNSTLLKNKKILIILQTRLYDIEYLINQKRGL